MPGKIHALMSMLLVCCYLVMPQADALGEEVTGETVVEDSAPVVEDISVEGEIIEPA